MDTQETQNINPLMRSSVTGILISIKAIPGVDAGRRETTQDRSPSEHGKGRAHYFRASTSQVDFQPGLLRSLKPPVSMNRYGLPPTSRGSIFNAW